MTDKRNTNNGDEDPHFDGVKEGIISDPGGKQIGIQTGKSNQFANPFDATSLRKNSEQEKLKKR
ncbi:hypothetical protein [Virgibacillus litoralis]|uniref:Uncharacterized protein n=1 Tax=Virgibacillus litoralis TaxID=578221 RepID=A0ABS4HIH8_9BACI|nr:hypothetical protein [Virgibacillus litoralis]MBP1950735.1 hypothetical protein [Virgibacillus litoralis]